MTLMKYMYTTTTTTTKVGDEDIHLEPEENNEYDKFFSSFFV